MQLKKRSSQSGYDGPSMFLKFEDGQQFDLLLVGDMHEFTKTWTDGKSTQRYKVNAVVLTPSPVVKIWEFSPTVYDQLYEVNEVYPLDKTMIRVKRQGVELNTTYNIMPLLGEKFMVTKHTEAIVNGLELHVLDREQKKAPKSDDGASWNGL